MRPCTPIASAAKATPLRRLTRNHEQLRRTLEGLHYFALACLILAGLNELLTPKLITASGVLRKQASIKSKSSVMFAGIDEVSDDSRNKRSGHRRFDAEEGSAAHIEKPCEAVTMAGDPRSTSAF